MRSWTKGCGSVLDLKDPALNVSPDGRQVGDLMSPFSFVASPVRWRRPTQSGAGHINAPEFVEMAYCIIVSRGDIHSILGHEVVYLAHVDTLPTVLTH